MKILSGFYIWGFHRLYYYSDVWEDTSIFGIPVDKCPLDLWIYQEIIFETKPDFIIETGTYKGGSALFFASICELIGQGRVVTIDIEDRDIPFHPRITKIVGNSVSEETVKEVKKLVSNKRCMVVLDSAHNKEHVLKEMELYGEFVSKGCYLTVEDTNINGHPVLPESGPGPMEAVEEFLRKRGAFAIDLKREKFMLTFCPKGFLKKIRE
jgi:cephalosporin hydroxylase